MTVDFRDFWGKARPVPGAAAATHPVAWHGLDVAACFLELMERWPALCRPLLDATAQDDAAIVPALAVLVALHDAGKFGTAFQARVREAYPACLGPWRVPVPSRHDAVGLALAESPFHLRPLLKTLFGANDPIPGPVVMAVFGHHGSPVAAPPMLERHMGPPAGPALRATLDYAQAVHALLGHPVVPPLRADAQVALSWHLAGTVALADWLGSDQSRFPYESASRTAAEYWEHCARPRARAAVDASGLLPAARSRAGIAARVLPPGAAASAVQGWARDVPLEDAGLFLIEDVMGAGKTEAALILAQRLMQAGRADGLYLALPTMATANALYRRMGALYRMLFAEEARPSLILAHGGRHLDDAFVASLGLEAAGADERGDEEAVPASAACARWLADDRRKAFLADVGVGTVDQALLAVLPVKHAGLRQLGLSRRVLIVDEAHGYDAFMQREIEALVEHQARLGGPVIVLSATLPAVIRDRLARAHARGAGHAPPAAGAALPDYPLATAMGARLRQTPLAVRADLRREVALRRLDDPAAAEALVAEAAARGAAVAYLRNSVDDAIDSHARLAAMGLPTELFHARFAMGDRLAIENRIVARYGRAGTSEERRGRVLVATQVVEQSIDLDFDLLVTDLAPVDLVLQRMGRMWRHARSGRGWPNPEIAVVSPAPVADAGADWYAAVLPRAQWVYRNHALLWLSARELFSRATIRVPEDLRAMVEAVYDPAQADSVPDALKPSGMEAEGADKAMRGVASQNVLDFAHGYMPGSGQWGPDTVTPTRLGEERRILRLCRLEGGLLVPWCADGDERRAWALSEVSVLAKRFEARAGLPPAVEAAAARLDSHWAERGIPATALPLSTLADGTATFGYRQRGGERMGTYSAITGLAWEGKAD